MATTGFRTNFFHICPAYKGPRSPGPLKVSCTVRCFENFKKNVDKSAIIAYNTQRRPKSHAPRGVAQMVAHVLWEHGAGGSNPFTPTILVPWDTACMALWSRGLRHRPFTAATRVRIPAGSFSRNAFGETFGPLAQLVRASGLYPAGPGFESLKAYVRPGSSAG